MRMATSSAAPSYVDTLRRGVEHTPVTPTLAEETRQVEQQAREERIEPELVAAKTNQGRFVAIHNTKATPREVLPKDLMQSKTGFLFVVEPIKAKIDEEKVKKKMGQLEKTIVIAYFNKRPDH
jgi:hypothetical protein